MPQVFKVGAYWMYFWANEGEPIEPIHVHISEESPKKNVTKSVDNSSRKMHCG